MLPSLMLGVFFLFKFAFEDNYINVIYCVGELGEKRGNILY